MRRPVQRHQGKSDTASELLERWGTAAHGSEPSTCPLCQLRDVLDRAATARWLADYQAHRVRRRQLLGVACCPLHVWRLHEVNELADAPPSPMTDWAESGAAETDANDVSHQSLYLRLLHWATREILRQFAVADARLERLDMRGLITKMRGNIVPALLRVRPTCPLCAAALEAERTALARFAGIWVSATSSERVVLAQRLCPADAQLSAAQVAGLHEFQTFDATQPTTGGTYWWQVPVLGMDDRSLVERLLEGTADLPDGICPACWARAEHERALVAALPERRRSAEADAAWDEEQLRHTSDTVHREAAVLCARHAAHAGGVVLEESILAGGLEEGKMGYRVPRVWPTGTLRSTPFEDACFVCQALRGHDVLRLAGLRRAVGFGLFGDDVTRRLSTALNERQTALCLPHWRAVTATGEQEVTWMLLDWQVRSVQALVERLEHQVVVAGTAVPAEAREICCEAVLLLGGIPT